MKSKVCTEWEIIPVNLRMSIDDITVTVYAQCWGDLGIHKHGGRWRVIHWPSGRWIFTSPRHERFVGAAVKRLAPLFENMPNKLNPDGDDPAYQAWFASVKESVMSEAARLAW